MPAGGRKKIRMNRTSVGGRAEAMHTCAPDSGTVGDGRREPPISGTYPIRMCIGCRQRAQAVDLLRVVARNVGPAGFAVVRDPERRLPGRGAWLHLDRSCLSTAERRRAFGRALRVAGVPDTAALREFLHSLERQESGPAGADPVRHESRDRHEHS